MDNISGFNFEPTADLRTPGKPIIQSLYISSDIKYTYAKTFVSSDILNPLEVAQEVHFRVVLPEEAFITGLVLTIKGKSYDAYIKEKEEAKKIYDQAISSGLGAAHVFQESRFAKDFTVSVNVEPQEKVNFKLTYEELLSRKNKSYQNTINVNPNQIVDNLTIVAHIEDALEIINVVVDEFNLSNESEKSGAGSIPAEIIRNGPNKVQIKWKPSIEDQIKLNKEGLNGQMIVKYDVNASETPQQILVDSDGYFMHILRNDMLPVLNKHVVFVLDVSASMRCSKIGQLKDAMKKILLDLSESDHFSIVLFSSKVVAWGLKEGANFGMMNEWSDIEPANLIIKDDFIVSASRSNIESALEFINTISVHNNTNILGGLRNGLKLAKKGQELNVNSTQPMESMIIFLTDGQPNVEESNPDKIIEKVQVLNNGVTIFTLGFGRDADMNFLKKLSLANHGFARRIYEDSDASIQLQNFYKEVASPVLSNIKFEYLPDQVEDVTSEGFKNLFLGSDVLVLGKVKPNGNVAGALTAISQTGVQMIQIPSHCIIVLPKEENRTLGRLAKMWAYKTIKSLLDKNTVSKNESYESKAKELALKYSFVTPLTSLVVVKPENSGAISDEESSGFRSSGFIRACSTSSFSEKKSKSGSGSSGFGSSFPASSPLFGSSGSSVFGLPCAALPSALFQSSSGSSGFGSSFPASSPLFGSSGSSVFGSPCAALPSPFFQSRRSVAKNCNQYYKIKTSNEKFCTPQSLPLNSTAQNLTKELPKAIIQSLHINSNIKYAYAKTFVNSEILNPAEVTQEVDLKVVLPEESFITGIVMSIKGKACVSYMKETEEEAMKKCIKTFSFGQADGHVFQESRFTKTFTVSVIVGPQEKVSFDLNYEELLMRKNRTYQNIINVNPNQIVDNLTIVVNIEDVLEIVNVKVDELGLSKDFENGDVDITKTTPNKVLIEWKPSIEHQTKLNRGGLNGQMIIKYDLNASKTPQQILVDVDGYFVHILRNDMLPVINKHVVFVLDVSGSMKDKIAQLQEAMQKILLDLSESDHFSIVLFSGKVTAWGPKEGVNIDELKDWFCSKEADITVKDDYVIPATRNNVESAQEFIKTVSTYYGKNILGGLRNGLKLAKKGQELSANSAQPMESMIIFLTDGLPNSEELIPDKITEKVQILNNGVSIFALGFGRNADMKFLKKLSLTNRGFARRIYEDSDASIQLQNFYQEVASPVLSDIKFEYLQDQVEDVTSIDFKNLFSGSEVLVLGKVKPNGSVSGVLTANSKTGAQRFQIPSDDIIILPKENKTPGHLEKMWAYKTIKSLLDKSTISKNDIIERKAKELASKYSFGMDH